MAKVLSQVTSHESRDSVFIVVRKTKMMNGQLHNRGNGGVQRGRSGGSIFLALSFLSGLSLLWSYLQNDTLTKILVVVEHAKDLFLPPKNETQDDNNHAQRVKSPLVGLNCDAYGGPSEEIAREMVYWEDIPSDSLYVSQFKKPGVTQYLSFEPDGAGWNNVRMGLETIIVMAYAMGRTLVLPPEEGMWTLPRPRNQFDGRPFFTFSNFYPLATIAQEHAGLEIITMQEFLEREAMTGNIRDVNGTVRFPPGNRTDWDRADDVAVLKTWLREVMHSTIWDPDKCMAVFPASTDPNDIQPILDMKASVEKAGGFPPYTAYIGKPNPVNASALDRMKENWAEYWIGGKGFCIYDQVKQNAHVLHFPFDWKSGARLLTHFYAFLFFQDWRQDLWMKRFVRDHIRYVDELQCAAARIVHAIREHSRERGDPNGSFDSFHIRRDDFGSQFRETQYEADKIYQISKDELRENATIYVATDERNMTFFDPMRQHYDLVFFDNYKDLIKGIHGDYYGMIEQLVASRGRVFFGCWLSTFTNYINRLRGYHANKAKTPGYEEGIISSWYYVTEQHRNDMRNFTPVYQGYYFREFPTSWRLIDTGIDEMKDFLAKTDSIS